ncbi:hypothetical protein [Maricaulis salignorans]|uniref:Type II secretion system (T2SS), protein M subtype b n=1 Tax=Maricaulis salignorans TaxID=144026 RepID=A0A1G9M0F3_9PROT|nr:hypothetical protein [Maricaulis salignorans]SDL67729.1 hypothetical protein SAMN04488568_101279 [Maricaulis salignorans]
MTTVFASLDARLRRLLAWAILGALALLVAVPLLISAFSVIGAWQRADQLRRDVSALTLRVNDQYDAVTAWYAANGETEDSLRAYSDPDLARQALDADLDQIAEVLIDAGAHLLQAPSVQQSSLGGTVTELVGEVRFSGALGDVLRAFAALEYSQIRIADLSLNALSGQPEGRVRGRLQLRRRYVTEADDES